MLRKHDRDRRGDLLLRLGAVVDVDGRPCLDIPDAFGFAPVNPRLDPRHSTRRSGRTSWKTGPSTWHAATRHASGPVYPLTGVTTPTVAPLERRRPRRGWPAKSAP
jgi:hypothetical protein